MAGGHAGKRRTSQGACGFSSTDSGQRRAAARWIEILRRTNLGRTALDQRGNAPTPDGDKDHRAGRQASVPMRETDYYTTIIVIILGRAVMAIARLLTATYGVLSSMEKLVYLWAHGEHVERQYKRDGEHRDKAVSEGQETINDA